MRCSGWPRGAATGASPTELRDQDNLAARVAALELPVGIAYLVQRERLGDRNLELTAVDQRGELGEHIGAGRGRRSLGLHPVSLGRFPVDDRVDPLGRDP